MDKAAHLSMVQGVINRMGGHSGIMKASAVGLVAGLAALASAVGPWPLFVAFIPVAVTCWMDAFYLRLDRLFRHLYDGVRKDDPRVAEDGPYSMSVQPWMTEANVRWRSVFGSWSVWPFYTVLAALAVGGAIVLLLRRG